MSYIERETALNLISDIFFVTDPNGEEQCGVIKCSKAIRNAPAADVVEVVRCKDCMYYHSISKLKYCNKHIDCWGDGEIYTDEDDYCSYGERRSEE